MDIHGHIFLLSGLENNFFFHSYAFFPLPCNDNNYMTYKWPNSSFFNFQENANQENCRQYSSIIFSIDKFGNKEPDEQKIYGWTEFFTSWTITSEKMHTGSRAREQKYIYIYLDISLYENLFENGCVCIYIYIYMLFLPTYPIWTSTVTSFFSAVSKTHFFHFICVVLQMKIFDVFLLIL